MSLNFTLIQNKKNVFNIDIVLFVFYTMVLLVLSYNYHAIWLIYDILALFSIIYFFKYMKKGMYLFFMYILVVYLFSGFITNMHFISLISVFDNYKHIFVLYMVLRAITTQPEKKSQEHIIFIYKVVEVLFYLQFFVVILQHFVMHLPFDDVAGTFGFHATHALGLFTLLYFILLLNNEKKGLTYKTLVLFIIIYINFLAENKGMYILLIMILVFRFPKYFLGTLIIVVPLVLVNNDFTQYTFSIIGRANEYLSVFSVEYSIPRSTRGELTAYALHLGGWLGAGIGKFSEVYSLKGWGVEELLNSQMAISTATQMISEIGILGLLFSIVTYVSLFRVFFKQFRTWAFVSLFFILLVFYNRVLMDERIAMGFIFIVVVIKLFDKTSPYKQNNKARVQGE